MELCEEVKVFSTDLNESGKITGGSILLDLNAIADTHKNPIRYTLSLGVSNELAKLHIGKDPCTVNGLMFKVKLDNGSRLNASHDRLTLLNTDCKSIW